MGVWVEILSIISGDQLQERIWRPLQKKGVFFIIIISISSGALVQC